MKIFAERGAGSGKQKILRQFDKVDVWNGDRLLSAEITQHAIADCRGIVGMIEKQRVENTGADKLRIFMNVNLVHKDQTNSFRSFIAFDIQTIVPFVL